MVERSMGKGINKGFNYNMYKGRDGEYIVELYYNDCLFCTSMYEKGMDLEMLAAKVVYEYLNCDCDTATTKILFNRMSERYF